MSFYGLYIPGKSDVGLANEATDDEVANESTSSSTTEDVTDGPKRVNAVNSPYVFPEKWDAIRILKMHKDARMREFNNLDEALNYSQTGCEVVQTKYNDIKTSTAAVEKPAFCAPTKQKLVVFRRAIEAANYELVKSLIWENPRYLVNSGDTPTSLKEGCRYNALHVCAIYERAEIGELILDTVSDPYFVNLLTGNKNNMKMCAELAANLLDYYLNIPEKGRLETPLHLASKYGNVKMVKLLTSYPICKMTRNKDNCFPYQIICLRASLNTAAGEITKLLNNRFYVPVLRSIDNAVPPQIGQPFSADNPPNLNPDPLSPEMKIQALAGPMEENKAKKFCRRWKTPPRLGTNTLLAQTINNTALFSTPVKSATPPKMSHDNSVICTTPKHHNNRSLFGKNSSTPYPKHLLGSYLKNCMIDGTPEKSFPRIPLNGIALTGQQNGNNLELETLISKCHLQSATNNNNVQEEEAEVDHIHIVENGENTEQSFAEERLIPSSPVNCSKIKEDHRNISVIGERDCDTPGFKERSIKIVDTEKGLEVIGRKLAKIESIDWCEHWDFLNAFIDISSTDGLQKLENYFAQRVRETELVEKGTQAANNNTSVILDDVCSAFEKIGFCKENAVDANNVQNAIVPQSTTPYTYVEKSLQVFAKRMTKTILHNLEDIISINDAFLSELKRLKSLICSFKDDPRFLSVNFAKVHSRFAYLIANYLQNTQDVDTMASKSKIEESLLNILMSPSKKQLHCVCGKIKGFFENPTGQVLPENLRTESMCVKAWLSESECECVWETNLNRKTSRRSRMETRYKNYQQTQKDLAAEKCRNKDKDEGKMSEAVDNNKDWRSSDTCNDSSDDVFWSDFGGSDTEDDEEEIWMTPPESFCEDVSDIEEEEKHNIFIYGNEPTKRDLDVLNALFNVDINSNNYPNIYKWKSAMLRYTSDDMDQFPSPAAPQKKYSFANYNGPTATATETTTTKTTTTPFAQRMPSTLPLAKRLFFSPTNKGPPHTPLNKMRGLFSTYRDYLNSSPISVRDADDDDDDNNSTNLDLSDCHNYC